MEVYQGIELLCFLCYILKRRCLMDFKVGDIIKMKKPHPCGTNQWEILRVGMDFRLRCVGCNHQVMVPRKLIEKNFKGFLKHD